MQVRTSALPGKDPKPVPLMFADTQNPNVVLYADSNSKLRLGDLSSMQAGENCETFLVCSRAEVSGLWNEYERQREPAPPVVEEKPPTPPPTPPPRPPTPPPPPTPKLDEEVAAINIPKEPTPDPTPEPTPRYVGDGKFPQLIRTALGVATVAQNWKEMTREEETSAWSGRRGMAAAVGWAAKERVRVPEPEELQHSPAPWFQHSPAVRPVCVSAPPHLGGRELRNFQRRMGKVPSRWQSDYSGVSRYPTDMMRQLGQLPLKQKPSLKLLDGFAVNRGVQSPEHFTLQQISLDDKSAKRDKPIKRKMCQHCRHKPHANGQQHRCTPWCEKMPPPRSRTSPGNLERLGDTFSSFTTTWDQDDFRKTRSLGDAIPSKINALPVYQPKWPQSNRAMTDTMSGQVQKGNFIWGNHAKIVDDMRRFDANKRSESPNLSRSPNMVWPRNLSPRSQRSNLYNN